MPSDVECPDHELTIAPLSCALACAAPGVIVEPLQVPDYRGYVPEPILSFPEPDPSSWARSETPAGACVYRIHGVRAECYPRGVFYTTSCTQLDGPTTSLVDFYDGELNGALPGCPPVSHAVDALGYWYYLVPRSRDTLDVVVCAPQCAGSFSSGLDACLSLRAPTAAMDAALAAK